MCQIYMVADLMTLDPDTADTQMSLRQILTKMKVDGCRQLPVLDEANRLVGIITDRDVRLAMNSPLILRERWQDEELLDTATAESCMTSDPVTVTPQMPAYRAAEILATYKFGALPVVEGDQLVGIITVTDILQRFVSDQRRYAGTTEGVIEGDEPRQRKIEDG